MEEALLAVPVVEHEERKTLAAKWDWKLFVEEQKRLCYIAVPMVIVSVSQYFSRFASMVMIGHLGELSLSSAAIATSLTNVTGFSLLFGMAGALETLCGQAYGAEQHRKLGIYFYCSIICLILVCVPVAILWIFVDKLLIFIGQDALISHEAGKYSVWLIFSVVPYAILQLLVRYLQSQSLIYPMLVTSIASVCFHLPVCWALVFKWNLGNTGAALAIGLSYWVNVILLWLYVMYSPACEKCRPSFSKEVFTSIGKFFHLAIPSAVMVCLEWSSFELVVLFCGFLPNPKLETSVLSICLTIGSLHYFIPYAVGAAASTRVANELGAGNAQAAQLAVWSVMALGVVEGIVASIILFCSRHVLGYAFSEENEVVDYVNAMTPVMCLSNIVDSMQVVLSGVARGSGWQHIGAYVNLGAFYLVGIPVALVLGFVIHMTGKGLWVGMTTGTIVQFLLLSLISCLTNWQKQAHKARERIFEGPVSDDNEPEI